MPSVLSSAKKSTPMKANTSGAQSSSASTGAAASAKDKDVQGTAKKVVKPSSSGSTGDRRASEGGGVTKTSQDKSLSNTSRASTGGSSASTEKKRKRAEDDDGSAPSKASRPNTPASVIGSEPPRKNKAAFWFFVKAVYGDTFYSSKECNNSIAFFSIIKNIFLLILNFF